MPNILIRNLDEKTLQCLKARAKRNGRSLQSEVKSTLEAATERRRIDDILADARAWRERQEQTFSDSAELIREDRER